MNIPIILSLMSLFQIYPALLKAKELCIEEERSRSHICAPLCHIFNMSLTSATFPALWKLGVIQSVFKNNGKSSVPQSYRPIALLSCVSKVFESFVREQLLQFCLDSGAIPDEQFGFLPMRSTVWQLLAVLEEWEQALDEGRCVHAAFLDVSKAFDRVDHGLLLYKLRSIGIHGKRLEWFEDYLRGRRICTTVDGVKDLLSCQSFLVCPKDLFWVLYCL